MRLTLLLLCVVFTGCIVEGEPCQTTGWSDNKASCVGEEYFQCTCNQWDEFGDCMDGEGSWQSIDVPMGCTCQSYRAGICGVFVG